MNFIKKNKLCTKKFATKNRINMKIFNTGNIDGVHKTSEDYQVNAVNSIITSDQVTKRIYNLNGTSLATLVHGINIINGKKVFVK